MDQILEELFEDNGKVLTLDIPDVDAMAATLYILNGGTPPPAPVVGDFAYDFAHAKFEVYHPNGWRSFTVADIESLLRHPNGDPLIVTFTASGAIPFWKQTKQGQVTERCNFGSIDAMLSHFRRTFDSRKLKVISVPSTPSLANPEQRTDSYSESFAGRLDVHSC